MQPQSPTHSVVRNRRNTATTACQPVLASVLPCCIFPTTEPRDVSTMPNNPPSSLPRSPTQSSDFEPLDMYIDSETDYLITELQNPQAQLLNRATSINLPEFPTCPGDNLVPHERTVQRPTPSVEFLQQYPNEAKLYQTVVAYGKPNYLGTREPVAHQLNIPAWRAVEKYISDKQLIDFLAYSFPIGYTGDKPPMGNLVNHSSARQAPEHVNKYLATEVGKQAALGPLS